MEFVKLEENIITENDQLETEILEFWKLLKGLFLLNRKKVIDLVEILKEFKEKKNYFKKKFYLGYGSPPGSGKSTILLLLAYFARKLEFIVVYIPNGNFFGLF